MADDSGLGGTTMQYQVLLDPHKLFAYGVTVPQISQQLGSNNANSGGGFYSQGGQFYYIRGLGLVRDTADIGDIVVTEKGGIPVYVKDLAKVEIGYAPRLGQFGFMHQDEAVEGVILMRVGEQAQVILKRVEAMTDDLNRHVLPPDVKVVPYYDRQSLIEETTVTVEHNLLRGMALVLVILGAMSGASAQCMELFRRSPAQAAGLIVFLFGLSTVMYGVGFWLAPWRPPAPVSP